MFGHNTPRRDSVVANRRFWHLSRLVQLHIRFVSTCCETRRVMPHRSWWHSSSKRSIFLPSPRNYPGLPTLKGWVIEMFAICLYPRLFAPERVDLATFRLFRKHSTYIFKGSHRCLGPCPGRVSLWSRTVIRYPYMIPRKEIFSHRRISYIQAT